MSTVFFYIPAGELMQRHINRSVNPDAAPADIPTLVSGGTTFYALEVENGNRFVDDFIDYKAYTPQQAASPSVAPAQIFGSKFDLRGLTAQSFTTAGDSTFTVTNPADRFVKRIWFESRASAAGDAITISVLSAADETLFTPITSWRVQLGITPFDFPQTKLLAGQKIRLVYNKTSGVLTTAVFTINIEQYKVV